jgi:hypothetical protein
VQTVGYIEKEKYRCIAENISTDEVIITAERIEHIKARHPGDYERFVQYMADIIAEPDYILEDEHPNTAMVLKVITDYESKEHFRLALRLVTSSDNPAFKNSIITFMKTHKKEYDRLVRNKKILYKRE